VLFGERALDSREAKHKAEAWAFFEHYFGGPPAARRAESGWGAARYHGAHAKLPAAKPYQRQALDVQDKEFSHYSVLKFSPYISVSAIDASLSQELVKGLDGGLSAGKLADAINSTLNPLLQQGKELIT